MESKANKISLRISLKKLRKPEKRVRGSFKRYSTRCSFKNQIRLSKVCKEGWTTQSKKLSNLIEIKILHLYKKLKL